MLANYLCYFPRNGNVVQPICNVLQPIYNTMLCNLYTIQCCAAHMQCCAAHMQWCAAHMQWCAAHCQVKLRIKLMELELMLSWQRSSVKQDPGTAFGNSCHKWGTNRQTLLRVSTLTPIPKIGSPPTAKSVRMYSIYFPHLHRT